MDYILGIKVVPAAEYSADPKTLNLFPAIYEGITVNLENDPPEPLIEGEGYDLTEDERTAYLVVILDKDGDGELDFDNDEIEDNDEIGYYCNQPTVINEDTTIDIIEFLGLDVSNIPELTTYLYGTYYMPTPIQRITKGENLDDV
ncbi:MAG: hypothetical protein JRC60_06380 [Deltaproteobacteria bacterium]|nr:hypothetical protein [Deltaproteobacteria bacterium]